MRTLENILLYEISINKDVDRFILRVTQFLKNGGFIVKSVSNEEDSIIWKFRKGKRVFNLIIFTDPEYRVWSISDIKGNVFVEGPLKTFEETMEKYVLSVGDKALKKSTEIRTPKLKSKKKVIKNLSKKKVEKTSFEVKPSKTAKIVGKSADDQSAAVAKKAANNQKLDKFSLDFKKALTAAFKKQKYRLSLTKSDTKNKDIIFNTAYTSTDGSKIKFYMDYTNDNRIITRLKNPSVSKSLIPISTIYVPMAQTTKYAENFVNNHLLKSVEHKEVEPKPAPVKSDKATVLPSFDKMDKNVTENIVNVYMKEMMNNLKFQDYQYKYKGIKQFNDFYEYEFRSDKDELGILHIVFKVEPSSYSTPAKVFVYIHIGTDTTVVNNKEMPNDEKVIRKMAVLHFYDIDDNVKNLIKQKEKEPVAPTVVDPDMSEEEKQIIALGMDPKLSKTVSITAKSFTLIAKNSGFSLSTTSPKSEIDEIKYTYVEDKDFNNMIFIGFDKKKPKVSIYYDGIKPYKKYEKTEKLKTVEEIGPGAVVNQAAKIMVATIASIQAGGADQTVAAEAPHSKNWESPAAKIAKSIDDTIEKIKKNCKEAARHFYGDGGYKSGNVFVRGVRTDDVTLDVKKLTKKRKPTDSNLDVDQFFEDYRKRNYPKISSRQFSFFALNLAPYNTSKKSGSYGPNYFVFPEDGSKIFSSHDVSDFYGSNPYRIIKTYVRLAEELKVKPSELVLPQTIKNVIEYYKNHRNEADKITKDNLYYSTFGQVEEMEEELKDYFENSITSFPNENQINSHEFIIEGGYYGISVSALGKVSDTVEYLKKSLMPDGKIFTSKVK